MLALALVLTACGPSPETDVGPTVARGTASAEPSDEPGTADRDDDAGTTALAVTLVQPGPASPDTPAPFRWYASLQTLTCAGLADAASANVPDEARALFLPLADVCRLLAGEDAAVDWDQARSALTVDVGGDCLLQAARDMLASAVSAHDSSPGAVLVPGPPAPGTACPPGIDVAELVDPTRVRLRGPYLFGPATVTVGGARVPAPDPAVEVVDGVPVATLEVSLPEPVCLDPSQPVSVRLQADAYEVAAVLTGSSDGCTTPAETTTDEATPQDQPTDAATQPDAGTEE